MVGNANMWYVAVLTSMNIGEFLSQRPVMVSSLISTWTDGWVNNQYAGDLRRHRA